MSKAKAVVTNETARNDEPPNPDFVSHADDPMLNYAQCGELVGRTGQTIKNWVSQDLLLAVPDPNGQMRIRKSELAKFYGATAIERIEAAREERNREQSRKLIEEAERKQQEPEEPKADTYVNPFFRKPAPEESEQAEVAESEG